MRVVPRSLHSLLCFCLLLPGQIESSLALGQRNAFRNILEVLRFITKLQVPYGWRQLDVITKGPLSGPPLPGSRCSCHVF